jgi:hypothetical protein
MLYYGLSKCWYDVPKARPLIGAFRPRAAASVFSCMITNLISISGIGGRQRLRDSSPLIVAGVGHLPALDRGWSPFCVADRSTFTLRAGAPTLYRTARLCRWLLPARAGLKDTNAYQSRVASLCYRRVAGR